MRVPGIPFVQGRNRYGTSTKYAIAVHATANTASAANEAAYATRREDGTSAHFYIDKTEVIQSLDTVDRAGHAGSTQGNTYAIALEFTGLNSWSREQWLASVPWDQLGAVLAALSRHHQIPATRATVAQMKANPRVRGAYDHNQMRLAWGGTDHTDPGPNFPWDRLLAVWQRHLTGEDDDVITDEDLARIAKAVNGYRYGALALYSEARDGNRNAATAAAGVAALRGQVAEMLGRDFVDEAEIVDGVLAGFGAKNDADIAAALTAALGAEKAAAVGRLLADAPPA